MISCTEIETLAHIVRTVYLIKIKNTLEELSPDAVGYDLLEQRYNELSRIIKKVFPE
jgi:hypothetical protein